MKEKKKIVKEVIKVCSLRRIYDCNIIFFFFSFFCAFRFVLFLYNFFFLCRVAEKALLFALFMGDVRIFRYLVLRKSVPSGH